MRVTHRMVAESIGHNLQRNLYRLDRLSNQLSSGKVFQRPSQDPVGVSKVMLYNTALKQNEQFRMNINEARIWLEATETALIEGVEILQRLRELSIYAANGTHTGQERVVIAAEAGELLERLMEIGNARVNELYIFGGHRTGQSPYRVDPDGGLVFEGDMGRRVQEISSRQELALNLTGTEAFGGLETFESARALHRALLDSDTSFLGNDALNELDRGINRLLQRLAEVGARQKRVETMHDTLFAQNLHLRQMLSEVEDIDMANTVTEFQMQENAYRAALSTAARMLQPSLVDYLR